MPRRFTFSPWTDVEISILRDKYPTLKAAEIVPLLPFHTRTSIVVKAIRLGLKHSGSYFRKRSPEFKRRMSDYRKEYYKTHDAPFKGKHVSDDVKELLRQYTIKQFENPEARLYVSNCMKRYFSDPVNREKKAKVSRERFNNPEFIKKYHNFLKKPNKLENRVVQVIEYFGLPFKYNGDFSQKVVIDCKIPDFVNLNGKNKVIEVFGDYWHGYNKGDGLLNEYNIIQDYKKVGFDCLVLWEHDIKIMSDNEIGERIKSFAAGGVPLLVI
jgi:G:T-mismatch repair DNA endonuclease (very short patch repair protein)